MVAPSVCSHGANRTQNQDGVLPGRPDAAVGHHELRGAGIARAREIITQYSRNVERIAAHLMTHDEVRRRDIHPPSLGCSSSQVLKPIRPRLPCRRRPKTGRRQRASATTPRRRPARPKLCAQKPSRPGRSRADVHSIATRALRDLKGLKLKCGGSNPPAPASQCGPPMHRR